MTQGSKQLMEINLALTENCSQGLGCSSQINEQLSIADVDVDHLPSLDICSNGRCV